MKEITSKVLSHGARATLVVALLYGAGEAARAERIKLTLQDAPLTILKEQHGNQKNHWDSER